MQLGDDVGDVHIDRGQADDQLVGDLLIAVTVGDQLPDFDFAGGQWFR
jgi:hypothetical protein